MTFSSVKCALDLECLLEAKLKAVHSADYLVRANRPNHSLIGQTDGPDYESWPMNGNSSITGQKVADVESDKSRVTVKVRPFAR
jgi:hypothetical protein